MEFNQFPEIIQTKMYVYLQKLGIGDGTARFVNDYNQFFSLFRRVKIVKETYQFFSHQINKNDEQK